MIKVIRYFREYGLKRTLFKIRDKILFGTGKAFSKAFGRQFVRSRYGVLLKANWSDATFKFCYLGSYGHFFANFIQDIEDDFVFLDIGANQGLYSLLSAKNSKCKRVFSFEPVLKTFEILRQNIDANRLTDIVMPIRSAVSSEAGQAQIHLKLAHSGAASLHHDHRDESDGIETVELISVAEIDELLPDTGAIVAKIDVEGYEDVVIFELMKSRHFDRVGAIYYEMDEEWNSAATIEHALTNEGFSEIRRVGDGPHYDVLALRLSASR